MLGGQVLPRISPERDSGSARRRAAAGLQASPASGPPLSPCWVPSGRGRREFSSFRRRPEPGAPLSRAMSTSQAAACLLSLSKDLVMGGFVFSLQGLERVRGRLELPSYQRGATAAKITSAAGRSVAASRALTDIPNGRPPALLKIPAQHHLINLSRPASPGVSGQCRLVIGVSQHPHAITAALLRDLP